MKICSNSPIPDFYSLYSMALGSMQGIPMPSLPLPGLPLKLPTLPGIPTLPKMPSIPNLTIPKLKIPPMPTLPNPIYKGISIPHLEILQIVQELQSYQMLITFNAMLIPMTTFLGLALPAILPSIPGTSLTLIDLLSLNPQSIVSKVSVALKHSGASIFPALPNPLFYAINNPAFQAIEAAKAAVRGYMNLLLGLVTNLIGQVTKKLKIPGMPSLPVMPTMATIQAMVMGKLPSMPVIPTIPPSLVLPSLPKMPNIPSMQSLLSRFSLNELIARIVIPGFPSLPALPIPLIPNFSMPEINLMQALSMVYINLITFPMTLIMNFINKALSKLGFSFPKICLSF